MSGVIAFVIILLAFCAACFGIGMAAGKIQSGKWDRYL